MLDMPTIDKTQEWEERLDRDEGDLRFPVTFHDGKLIGDIEITYSKVEVKKPRLKNSQVREIKLGKKTKNNNKGKELF